MSETHGESDESAVGPSVGEEFIGLFDERPRRAGLTGWLETVTTDIPFVWRRRIGSAAVVGVGLLIMAPPFYRFFRHASSLATLLSDAVPLLFSVVLLYSGIRIHWHRANTVSLPLVAAFWVVSGFVVAGGVSLYFLTLHSIHGYAVESMWFLVYDVAATGAIAGLLISRYDTRARRRHDRLSQRERQFRAVFEGTLDALVITDNEGRYVAANPAAADLFGLPREELIGKHVADFAPDRTNVDQQWAAFLEEGDQRGEFQLRRPDGDVRTVAFAATANVLPGRHLSALRDVTARTERERELAEERARVEFLNQLLRHNILNGMNLVLAKFDALEPAVPEANREDLDVARHRSEEIVDLVQTARRLATGVSNRVDLERIDLVDSLSDAVETVRQAYPDATILFTPPDHAVSVRADEMLMTVFDHLLTNTVEHNDTADLTVTVDVMVDAETVTVTVADDGVGISEERRGELFGDGTFTHTRDWGGFGLSIVDVLVQEYDGRVWAEANDPTGVVFHVELQRADDEP